MAKKIRNMRGGPELEIQKRIENKLRLLGWFVIRIHGSVYLTGIPDVIATHKKYGIRLIEIKNPKAYSFTPAQIETFPKLCENGCGVWVLVDDSMDEINKLFKPPNWSQYYFERYL